MSPALETEGQLCAHRGERSRLLELSSLRCFGAKEWSAVRRGHNHPFQATSQGGPYRRRVEPERCSKLSLDLRRRAREASVVHDVQLTWLAQAVDMLDVLGAEVLPATPAHEGLYPSPQPRCPPARFTGSQGPGGGQHGSLGGRSWPRRCFSPHTLRAFDTRMLQLGASRPFSLRSTTSPLDGRLSVTTNSTVSFRTSALPHSCSVLVCQTDLALLGNATGVLLQLTREPLRLQAVRALSQRCPSFHGLQEGFSGLSRGNYPRC